MRARWGFISWWGGGGGKNRMYFICLQVDGPITEGGGEGLISGSLRLKLQLKCNETTKMKT